MGIMKKQLIKKLIEEEKTSKESAWPVFAFSAVLTKSSLNALAT